MDADDPAARLRSTSDAALRGLSPPLGFNRPARLK
jgi:hypothetical protein